MYVLFCIHLHTSHIIHSLNTAPWRFPIALRLPRRLLPERGGRGSTGTDGPGAVSKWRGYFNRGNEVNKPANVRWFIWVYMVYQQILRWFNGI